MCDHPIDEEEAVEPLAEPDQQTQNVAPQTMYVIQHVQDGPLTDLEAGLLPSQHVGWLINTTGRCVILVSIIVQILYLLC